MEDKERRSESLAADRENKNAILLEQFRDRSCEKNCDESFQDFGFCDFAVFEISNFANSDFCVLPRSARPSLGDPALHPALHPAFRVRRGRRTTCAAMPTCTPDKAGYAVRLPFC